MMQKLGINLSRYTSVVLKQTISTQESDVLFQTVNNAGVITLNRPKVLNALNMSMINKIFTQLLEWEQSKSVIILKGAGEKAFSAGGDLKACTDKIIGPNFFFQVYNVNYLIEKFKIPFIALMNGITMGGCLSLSVQGKYRIATEKTVIAMPETKIGLIPDVGASYYLPRLQDNLGFYLGLTSERLIGKDVIKAGIATHFVSTQHLCELEKLLCQCTSDSEISALLTKFNEPAEEFSLTPNIKHISYCFAAETVEKIIERLENVNNEWSEKTLKNLSQLCPGSLKVTLQALQRGAQLDLGQCLKMEFRAVCRAFQTHDFHEGVRAILIDKDNNPQWNPKTLAEVSDDYVESYFEKLPEDKELYFTGSKL